MASKSTIPPGFTAYLKMSHADLLAIVKLRGLVLKKTEKKDKGGLAQLLAADDQEIGAERSSRTSGGNGGVDAPNEMPQPGNRPLQGSGGLDSASNQGEPSNKGVSALDDEGENVFNIHRGVIINPEESGEPRAESLGGDSDIDMTGFSDTGSTAPSTQAAIQTRTAHPRREVHGIGIGWMPNQGPQSHTIGGAFPSISSAGTNNQHRSDPRAFQGRGREDTRFGRRRDIDSEGRTATSSEQDKDDGHSQAPPHSTRNASGNEVALRTQQEAGTQNSALTQQAQDPWRPVFGPFPRAQQIAPPNGFPPASASMMEPALRLLNNADARSGPARLKMTEKIQISAPSAVKETTSSSNAGMSLVNRIASSLSRNANNNHITGAQTAESKTQVEGQGTTIERSIEWHSGGPRKRRRRSEGRGRSEKVKQLRIENGDAASEGDEEDDSEIDDDELD